MNHEGFGALTHVYDAALNPGRWRRALDAVSVSVEAKAAALLIREHASETRDRQMLNTTYLRFTRTPSGLYYGLRYSRLQDPDWDFLSRQQMQTPVPDTDTGLTAVDLDHRGDYAYLRKKLGVGRRLGVRLNGDRAWFDAISIAFDKTLNSIPRSSVEMTRHLLPHLTKAVEIGRTFSMLKSRYSAVLGALDKVKVGLAIALPSGEIIVTNEEIERIFDLKDGLKMQSNGMLACFDDGQTLELKSAVVAASMTAHGRDNAAEHIMALKRPSHGTPLLIDVAPLKDSAAELDGALEGALITVIDPNRINHLNLNRFAILYELTEAEAQVCKMIMLGAGIPEIAETRNTSPVTVKNQIASLLAKVGVHKRTDLIRLIIKILPPIE